MGELPATIPCKVCNSVIGADFTRDILLGIRTLEDMCNNYNITMQEAMEHVDKHVVSKDENGNLTSEDMYLGKLTFMVNTLGGWIEKVINKEEVSRNTVIMLTSLMKEQRQTLEMLAQMQGRAINTSGAKQTKNSEARVMMLTQVIIQKVCPQCQRVIIDILDETP
jgi:hypothetical protein